MVYVQGKARIRHAKTGKIYTIDADQIDFDVVGSDERPMGPQTTHSAIMDHPQLGQLAWDLWEYPVGAENYRETDVGPHELLENVDFGLQPEPPGDDDHGEKDADDEDRQARIDALVEWFFERFEDPAQRLPYESAEGGYQWIYGGPYDAREELGDNFHDEAEDIIEAAVDEIESDGLTDWAPVASPEDYDDGDNEGRFGEDYLNETAQELESLISGIPEPPTGPVFRLGGDGLVYMAPAPGQPSTAGDSELFEELCSAVADLSRSLVGTNAHTLLRDAVDNYEAALLNQPPSIWRIYARGVRLENASKSAHNRIEAEDLPPLTAETEQHLGSVLGLHAAYIMSEEGGRRLAEDAANYRRTPDENAALKDTAEQFSSTVNQRPDLFSKGVRTHVGEVAQDVGAGPRSERSNQVAATSIGNMVAGLLKLIGGTAFGAILGSAVTTSASGTAATAVGASAITAIASFLTINAPLLMVLAAAAGFALLWLEPIAYLLDKLRRRGKK